MSALHDLRRVVARALGSSPDELAFAARAWALAPFVEAALAGLGVGRTLDLVARVPTRRARRPRVPVERGAAWVDRAYAVHALRGRCLPRAIVQHVLHRLDGTPSRLVIGVRTRPEELDAHAWVSDGASDPHGGASGSEGFAAVLVVDDAGVHPASVPSP